MLTLLTTILGKTVQRAARLRGGGSALPGLVVEKINPKYTADLLSTLEYGTVVISGTNGKTTTTKIVVELLESQGLKVLTNKTGSNFSRGVTATIIDQVTTGGKLDADIAVLELDEAHAVHFVKAIPPTYSLLLNVMRDQLDRFGEIDATAKLLNEIAKSTTKTIILNREDPLIARSAQFAGDDVSVKYFGLSDKTRDLFPNDEGSAHHSESPAKTPAAVELAELSGNQAKFTINKTEYETTLTLKGIYNAFNAAAAIALVTSIIEDQTSHSKLIEDLALIRPAFGRGETIKIGETEIDLVLVKNPGGLSLALQSFSPEGYQTAFAINDNYSDGRDMSWLWDVSFDSLLHQGVSVATGVRAYDMALRLQYDEVAVDTVEPDINQAVDHLLKLLGRKKRIYCTYTAMLSIRKKLSKLSDIEEVL